MAPNTAQVLIHHITDGGNSLRDYRAPHAYRPTPNRPRFSREQRFSGRKPRLFKGYRV